MSYLKKIEKIICTVLEIVIAIILAFMVISMCIQVATRYFVSVQLTWVEDVCVLSMQWIAGIGIPLAWFRGTHLTMDITDKVYSEKVKRFFYIALQIVALYAAIRLISLGFYNFRLNKGFKESGVGYDESFRYVPLIICGFLLSLATSFKCIEIIASFVNKKKKEVAEV